MTLSNIDEKTVEDFGYEWSRFDQEAMSKQDAEDIFSKYFSIFPF